MQNHDFGIQVYQTLRQLRPFTLKLTRSADRADDLMQTAAMKALQHRDKFQVGTNLAAWLSVIIRYTFFAENRRKLASITSAWDDTTLDIADPRCVERAVEIRIDLPRHMARMSPAQREAVLTVGAYGYSYDEASEIIGCHPDTVKSRVHRARRVEN